MRQFDCPQCGAPVPFETPGAAFAVCGYCHCMVVRREMTVESIGQMADLPPDNTPLQIGAQGTYGSRSFRLLGRLRVGWGDGSWNEWFTEFSDGAFGWVAEAQGFFLISESKPFPETEAQAFPLGVVIQLGRHHWHVVDVKKATVISGEGELPFVAKPGDSWEIAELVAPGWVAVVETHPTGRMYFEGQYVGPEDIKWQGLRPVPGWKGEPLVTERGKTHSQSCPQCGGVIALQAAGMTMTVRCSHCGTLVDTDKPEARIAQAALAQAALVPPKIPLGTRTTLDDEEWMVIGFLRRKDQWATWGEYLLYNPWQGFIWLTEFNGHWNLIHRVLDTGYLLPEAPKIDGVSYRLFANEETQIVSVQGEFYWKVRAKEASRLFDFIAPPYILSREINHLHKDESWSKGRYLEPAELKQAFPNVEFPSPEGIYLNQPNPFERRRALWHVFGAALVVLLAIQLFFYASRHRRTVLSETFEYTRPAAGAPITPITSKSFDLDGGHEPVKLTSSADLDNSWLGYDVALVNEQTGQTFDTEVNVEYYHGYDDGYWSEGGKSANSSLPSVPAGRYHLTIEPLADPLIPQMPFTVNLQRGGLFISNFIFALLALLIIPLYNLIRSARFEGKRWSQSDFSPSTSSQSIDSD